MPGRDAAFTASRERPVSTPGLSQQQLDTWVGRSEQVRDRVTARPVEILKATLDRDPHGLREGDPIPAGWHWLYFHEVVRLDRTGHDGHPARGGFLPPVPLPRRMWAGNRMDFHVPLHVGEQVSRTSTIHRASFKRGASGDLCFVTVRHELHGEAGLATIEEHDIVFREAATSGAAPPPAMSPPQRTPLWQREVVPGPVLLFRFSALTMNSHRIHYDRDFCVRDEGYPGLLVHGPLTMLLLMDLFDRHMPGASPTRVSVRARSPLFDTAPMDLAGTLTDDPGTASLWACGPGPALAMSAELSYLAGERVVTS